MRRPLVPLELLEAVAYSYRVRAALGAVALCKRVIRVERVLDSALQGERAVHAIARRGVQERVGVQRDVLRKAEVLAVSIGGNVYAEIERADVPVERQHQRLARTAQQP